METSDSDLSWEQRAMRLRSQHPQWTRTRIARELGVQESTLVRSRLFMQAMALDQPVGTPAPGDTMELKRDGKKEKEEMQNTDVQSDPENMSPD